MPIALSIAVYAPGVGGAPTLSTPVSDLRQLISYEHTITASCGFESMRASFATTTADALDWLINGLMRACVVFSPDGTIVWEGYLSQIDATFGQEKRSVALDGMRNRMRTRYTTVLGTAGVTSTLSDTTSQNQYGIKDGVLSLGTTTASIAASTNARGLREYKNPVMSPSTEVSTGDMGDVQIELLFAGWYTTFDWVLTSNTSTTNTTTTSQIQTLTTAFRAVNAFVSNDYSNISSSGIADTEYIEPDTTYRAKIEALLEIGDSGNERLAWGIYEYRRWKINEWAGATPTILTYQRDLGSGMLYDANGGIVMPWDVRPDAMCQTINLLDPMPVTGAQDTAGRFYVERVTCTIGEGRIGVSLEPKQTTAIDALLARIK